MKTKPCKFCKKWKKTGRPCSAEALGECDCPVCQGLCECHDYVGDLTSLLKDLVR
jgi:hypothetical protein